MIDVVLNAGIKFVTTSAGDPAKYIHILKDAGIKVFHAVPNVAGAKKAVDAGVDGLVVEGTEGGGFKSPEEVGLFVLIQAIRNITDLPIVAAGGIVDGREWQLHLQLVQKAFKWVLDLFPAKKVPCMKTLKTTSSILMSRALGY